MQQTFHLNRSGDTCERSSESLGLLLGTTVLYVIFLLFRFFFSRRKRSEKKELVTILNSASNAG